MGGQEGRDGTMHFVALPQMRVDNRVIDFMTNNLTTTGGMPNPHHPTMTNNIDEQTGGTTDMLDTTSREMSDDTNTRMLARQFDREFDQDY